MLRQPWFARRSAMKRYLVSVVFSVGLIAAGSAAQSSQSKPALRHPPDFPQISTAKPTESRGEVVTIEIAADKRVRTPGIKGYESWAPGPEAIKKAFAHYLETQKPKPSEHAVPARVVLRIDPLLDMLTVFDYVRIARSGASELSVEVSDYYSLNIAPEPDDRIEIDVKPNPLFLIAGFDDKGSITLNNEAYGGLKDLSVIQQKLKNLFREREINGVFRENTNEIEKTVFLRVPESARFADVTSFAKAVADAGSDRLWLAIEKIMWFEERPELIELEPFLPAIKPTKQKAKRKPRPLRKP